MSKLVQEVRHFTLQPEAAGASHDEIADEAMRLAKGGHIVRLTLPEGNVVTVAPSDVHPDVVARVAEAMPKPAADGMPVDPEPMKPMHKGRKSHDADATGA
jgi:hypothetical protein